MTNYNQENHMIYNSTSKIPTNHNKLIFDNLQGDESTKISGNIN